MQIAMGPAVLGGTATPPSSYKNELLEPPEPMVRPERAYTLRAELTENGFGPYRLRHLPYDGGPVGPTIRVRPGETFRVRLENRLPQGEGDEGHNLGAETGTQLNSNARHVAPDGGRGQARPRLRLVR